MNTDENLLEKKLRIFFSCVQWIKLVLVTVWYCGYYICSVCFFFFLLFGYGKSVTLYTQCSSKFKKNSIFFYFVIRFDQRVLIFTQFTILRPELKLVNRMCFFLIDVYYHVDYYLYTVFFFFFFLLIVHITKFSKKKPKTKKTKMI